MMSPPRFQSHRNPTDHRCHVTSFENDIWNLGLASPTTITFPVESLPTIWVADLPCSIWNAPSPVPKPPTWNAGTGSDSTRLLLVKKLVRKIQFALAFRIGLSSTESSSP